MTTESQYTEELVITRVFDAPRDRVFKAWTDCDVLKQWWGPKDFTTPYCEIDARPGGKSLSCMRSPEGKDYWGTGTYREIIESERIVVTDSFADERGNVVPATYYGMSADFPLEMLITVTFEEHEGKTKLTLRHLGIPAGEDRDGARAGWSESFDKLAEVLKGGIIPTETEFIAEPGKHYVISTRVFDAPRERVFEMYTDPGLMPEWWGPRSLTTTVDRMDVRPGGLWRVVQRDAGGNEFALHGVYHEVASPERIVCTFEFEGEPGHAMMETVTLEELDGKTKVVARDIFQTVEDRDAALQSGMKEGLVESMDRFAELLARGGEMRRVA